MNRDVARYCREVWVALPSGFRQKKKLIKEIRRNIRQYQEENSLIDYVAIVTRFGTPLQIAASYVEEMEPQDVLRGLDVKKTFIRIVAVCMAAIVLIWAIGVGICVVDSMAKSGGYWVVYVDEG